MGEMNTFDRQGIVITGNTVMKENGSSMKDHLSPLSRFACNKPFVEALLLTFDSEFEFENAVLSEEQRRRYPIYLQGSDMLKEYWKISGDSDIKSQFLSEFCNALVIGAEGEMKGQKGKDIFRWLLDLKGSDFVKSVGIGMFQDGDRVRPFLTLSYNSDGESVLPRTLYSQSMVWEREGYVKVNLFVNQFGIGEGSKNMSIKKPIDTDE